VKSIPVAAPRLGNLPEQARKDVLSIYHALGGRQASPALRPGAWDVEVAGILIELDEQLHFNRYRARTLTAASYSLLSRFPLAVYQRFCSTKESVCLKMGASQGRWMNDSTEAHFGPSAARGVLTGGGSSRWKQRALYDLMKDLTQLNPDHPRVARLAMWDPLPSIPGVTVEDAVHRRPTDQTAHSLRVLLEQRGGRSL
jgi:hypothetical protein